MPKYRKKPVVIEAVQFTGKNFFEISEFTNGNAHDCYMQPEGYTTCIINTLEGMHIATEGDFIIKGVHGEFYPCKPDIFEKTYEAADLPKTNADRIRAMSDEELAQFMFSMVDCVSCENKLMNNGKLVFGDKRKTCTDKDYHAMCNGDGRKCQAVCLEWLKQPAEKGD